MGVTPEISNQYARLLANAVVYDNSTILSRLLTKYEVSGNAKASGRRGLSSCLRAQLAGLPVPLPPTEGRAKQSPRRWPGADVKFH